MKFYEIIEPYWALIKAPNEDEAIEEYVRVVADDDVNQPLSEEIKEVDRDYAVARFSRVLTEDGGEVPLDELLASIRSEETSVLAMDGSLL